MMTTEHLLALFLFIGIPLGDMFETRALKTSTDPRRQILTYRRIAVVEWTVALVAWIALRSRVFLLWPGARHTAREARPVFCNGPRARLYDRLSRAAYVTRRNLKLREKTLDAFKRLAFILPVTREERARFAAVSITAGVCEEVWYRGFLIRYLSDFPWHAGLLTALRISSIAFGMAHGDQALTGSSAQPCSMHSWPDLCRHRKLVAADCAARYS
jgi:uncharacterized protein